MEELNALVPREKAASINAVKKLEALGPDLSYPHSSAVRNADRLRELRPRGGRSAWRSLYRQVGTVFVVAAVVPEAEVDHRAFAAGCKRAEERLAMLEEE